MPTIVAPRVDPQLGSTCFGLIPNIEFNNTEWNSITEELVKNGGEQLPISIFYKLYSYTVPFNVSGLNNGGPNILWKP